MNNERFYYSYYAINSKSWKLKNNYVTYKKEQILEYDIGDSIPYCYKVKEEYDFSFFVYRFCSILLMVKIKKNTKKIK